MSVIVCRPGWALCKIDDFGKLIRGISYSKEQSAKSPGLLFVPILRANNINEVLNFDDLTYVPRLLVNEEQYIKKGDLVFAMSSGSLNLVGKSAAASADFEGSCGAFCAILRIDNKVSYRFASFLFQSNKFRRKISEIAKGSNINNLKREHILDYEIAMPPFAEQRRIVEKVEELFSELDQGIENLKKARAQLAVYRQALLKHAFEGKLTAEWRKTHEGELESADQLLARIRAERDARYQQQSSEWNGANRLWVKERKTRKQERPQEPKPISSITRKLTISDLADRWLEVSVGDILIGKPTNGRSVQDRAGGFKVLRLTSLKNGSIDLTATKEGAWDESEAAPYILRRGDFLISRGNGTLGLVGRGGIVKDDCPVAYPDTMVRLIVDPLVFDSRLFSFFWNAAIFRQQIETSAKTTAGIYKINQSIINNLRFPLMPRSEQAVLISILESLLPEIDRLESEVEKNLHQAEALRQSILKKAFAGELVPQDPNDEPASELLARIREERARQDKTSRRAKALRA